MPNYLPATYQPNWNYGGIGQQMYPQYAQSTLPAQIQQGQPQQNSMGIKWVDGEVGAKAYQMPAGWPANQPIALWDTNDCVIYLKSINPMGMPNPLQKAHYKLEEYRGTGPATPTSGAQEPDASEYVKKTDMERMKQELMDAISNVNTGGKHGTKEETK